MFWFEHICSFPQVCDRSRLSVLSLTPALFDVGHRQRLQGFLQDCGLYMAPYDKSYQLLVICNEGPLYFAE